MITKNVIVTNKTGIHARPATLLVRAASRFKANITIANGAKQGNAKSLINILALAINKGSNITISAEGDDADEAVESLIKLIESKFGEE